MKKYTQEEKLRISTDFLNSVQWQWLRQEFETKAKMFEPFVYTRIENDDDFIYKQGVLAGIRWCMNRPQEIKEENEKIFNRILNAIGGKTNGA